MQNSAREREIMTVAEAKTSTAPVVERVKRHALIDRLYHWAMGISVLILLGTAFLPIAGIKFDWLQIHWITGLVLGCLILFHIVRALVWQDRWAMVIDLDDIKNAWRIIVRTLRKSGALPGKPGKYNGLQKLYHVGIALLILAMVITGVTMLFKIDTPWWNRNPYFLSDDQWGIIYIIHDYAAMLILSAVIIHIYFAIRPDEWHLSRSMFRGWITRDEYLAHHDPRRWKAGEEG
jgi:cytochrome b subunit of formate dehydrogenase